METHWQLQSSRTPPAPISLAGGRAPNASVYATWYLYWRGVAGGHQAGHIWMGVNELSLTIWLLKCPPRPFLCLYRKKVYTVHHLTLTWDYLKSKRNTLNIRLYIYIRCRKMKNRNIHSKVISVKLFCREKVLRMYCTFILICWFFANKILCLRPDHLSSVFIFLF